MFSHICSKKVGAHFEGVRDKREETLQLYGKWFVLIETNIGKTEITNNMPSTTRFPTQCSAGKIVRF